MNLSLRIMIHWACVGLITAGSWAMAGWSTRAQDNELVIVTSGGIFEQALRTHFFEPFTAETGIEITVVQSTEAEQWTKATAMAKVGRTDWDIVSSGSEALISQQDLLMRIPCDELRNLSQASPGSCTEFGLMRTIGGDAFAYLPDRFAAGKVPSSWADFWDVATFPGPRGMNAIQPWYTIAVALEADGVAPEELKGPLDLDRAFRKLDEIKPHVAVWWKTGDQAQAMFRDGEVIAGMVWDGRARSLQTEGVPLKLVYGVYRDPAYWAVLKDAPHKEAAQKFLDFFLDNPESHFAFAQEVNYDTPSIEALALFPEDERVTRVTYPDTWENLIDLDAAWIAEHRGEILDRWNAWLGQ